jgi:hypothetical protein
VLFRSKPLLPDTPALLLDRSRDLGADKPAAATP